MRISGLQVADAAGRIIENPTPFQVRMALVQLLEQTGSRVLTMTVDDVLIAYVMAGDDEVPDAKADAYSKHLVQLAEQFVEMAKSARHQFLKLNSRGGLS